MSQVQLEKGETNLGKGDGVDAVLAGNLEADSVAGLGVPGGLGAGLDLAVDLVVVGSGEDAQVVGGGDGGAVLGGDVADGGAVAGQGGLVDIIAGAGTGEEALVADDGIDVGGGALEEVEEGSAVEAGLLEEQVELGALGGGGGQEVEEALELEALGQGVADLDLGVEGVGRVPGLGQGQTCERAAALVSMFGKSGNKALACACPAATSVKLSGSVLGIDCRTGRLVGVFSLNLHKWQWPDQSSYSSSGRGGGEGGAKNLQQQRWPSRGWTCQSP